MWGDCSPSAIIDCQMVPPVLNPFLADVPGIQGIDGSEMLEVDRAMMRDLPYGELTRLQEQALFSTRCDALIGNSNAASRILQFCDKTRLRAVHAGLCPKVEGTRGVWLWAMLQHSPAGWDCLVENVIDPSHVNWSHHNHIGERQVLSALP